MKKQIIFIGSGGCMRELAWQMPDRNITGYEPFIVSEDLKPFVYFGLPVKS